MTTITIEATRLGPETTIEAPYGGRLLDLCDDARAGVRFSCRSASCGTCRVDVLEGAGALEEPDDAERETLAFFGDPPRRRLACVAHVRPGTGFVRLRVVAPDEPDAA